jgi:hypothetical protein
MNSNRFPMCFSTLLLAAAGAAQGFGPVTTVTDLEATYTRTLGDNEAGLTLTLNGLVESRVTRLGNLVTNSRYRAQGTAAGVVRLRNNVIPAVNGFAFGQVQGTPLNFGGASTWNAGYTVSLGGQVVWTQNSQGSADFVFSRTAGLDDPTIRAVNFVVPTGVPFVDVAVNVDVGADADLSMTATLRPVTLSARLVGTIAGRAFGRATASLGVLCARVGVTTDLDLLDSSASVNFTAAQAGLTGVLTYSMDALRILLSLYAEWCAGSATLPIWNRTFGSFSGQRTLL